eukprot:CAMPEP_0174962992 /NCGR_PEP_ID=MMETSP0004_2-20121128/5076_1 /TAXON_ID=420556 /ORGANISM="Ochromonas sp., Strain CCMP1393" /LENGTH=177 /DNA_ID=CAMNT_0016211555 /DNA_START=116 /DNA_END=649 /DNA_ORIENTATION=+
MKFISTAFLFFYCAVNWMVGVVVAFTPSFALSSKKQPANGGFYGKLSGIMRSGGLSSLFKRHTTLDMVASYRPEKISGISWRGITNALLPFTTSSLKASSAPEQQQSDPQMVQSDSGLALSHLVMLQSTELNRSKKTSFAYTEVAGFMEYDPKVAAKVAHKRRAQSSLNRSGRWFRL